MPSQLPPRAEPGVTADAVDPSVVALTVHDDLEAAVRKGLNPSVELCVQVHNLVAADEADLDRMMIKVNGVTIVGQVDASGIWVVTRPDLQLFTGDPARIELALPSDCASTLIVHDVHVMVRH